MNKMITLLFFSGTGGVRRIANEFKKQLSNRSFMVRFNELDFSKKDFDYKVIDNNISNSQYLFILYPVYAFDAPDILYTWINNTNTSLKNTIVISVSGGGEVWPNLGTRMNFIKSLEKKGYTVTYEKMMVMPSNFVFKVNDDLGMWLIKVIPEKVNIIINNVLSGNIKRNKKYRRPLFQSIVSKLKKCGARKFGKSLRISDDCTACMICVHKCPSRNIDIIDNRPVFSDKCLVCFRCIYQCPSQAIRSNNFMVLNNGYNLNDLEKRMIHTEPVPLQKCGNGLLWRGVRQYLHDQDGN